MGVTVAVRLHPEVQLALQGHLREKEGKKLTAAKTTISIIGSASQTDQ